MVNGNSLRVPRKWNGSVLPLNSGRSHFSASESPASMAAFRSKSRLAGLLTHRKETRSANRWPRRRVSSELPTRSRMMETRMPRSPSRYPSRSQQHLPPRSPVQENQGGPFGRKLACGWQEKLGVDGHAVGCGVDHLLRDDQAFGREIGGDGVRSEVARGVGAQLDGGARRTPGIGTQVG